MKAWPALATPVPWDGRLKVEQGVWGKVHRQSSDFRWIAASPGLDVAGLGTALGAGAEDQPTRCLFWRHLEDGSTAAVSAYPSRAIDAAGRSGFLERRVFLWRPEAGVSIVRGMLALLPTVESFALEHDLARTVGEWLRPDFHLPLESLTFEISAEELDRRVERGRKKVAEALGKEALTAVYARLLSGQRPAVLASPRPFSANALAALLLPLPTDLAGTLSLAGWIPSSRASAKGLAENWQLVVGQVAAPAAKPAAEHIETALQWAEALVEGRPYLLETASSAANSEVTRPIFPASEDLESTPEQASPSWLEPLQTFARDADARWLDPVSTAERLGLDDRVAPLLLTLWREVEGSMPERADTWQWAVKVDLIAALLVAIAPGSSEAGELVFDSGRVPALLFVDQLEPEQQAVWRRRCPPERMESWAKTATEKLMKDDAPF